MSRAAVRYAKALLSTAKDKNELQPIHTDMDLIQQTLASNSELRSVLSSTAIKAADKKIILHKVFTHTSSTTKLFFDVLVDKKRTDLLEEIAGQYKRLYEELQHNQLAVVTTAVPLNKTLEDKVMRKIKELTGRSAQLENKIDPDIIGGFILRIGDLQYNASISSRLDEVKRQLTDDSYTVKL